MDFDETWQVGLRPEKTKPNFPRTRVQVVARDTWFHIPEKFPLRGRISRKTLFLGYPLCDQATGHGKRSATPTLFPSPSGHTRWLLLRDVPFSSYPPPKVLSAMAMPG